MDYLSNNRNIDLKIGIEMEKDAEARYLASISALGLDRLNQEPTRLRGEVRNSK
jgi:hypothetical protein